LTWASGRPIEIEKKSRILLLMAPEEHASRPLIVLVPANLKGVSVQNLKLKHSH
jgi:hypothetical protein